MPKIALGLGGNIGNVMDHLQKALMQLEAHEAIHIEQISSYYKTPAWGEVDQPDFINICAIGKSTLSPEELLKAVKEIELLLGRTQTYRWGPRVIDIDILLWGEDEQVNLPHLIIPHKEMSRRAFVLVPLAEIAADWRVNKIPISDLCNALPQAERQNIELLD